MWIFAGAKVIIILYLCFDIMRYMNDIRHKPDRLSARDRVTRLFDEGSFCEFRPDDAGLVTGKGKVAGRVVYAYAQDSSVAGGAMSEEMASRICEVMDMALEAGSPVVSLNDSVGAKIQEGVGSLAGYAEIFKRNIKCSGVIPQISGILGPCAGGAVYSPALTDFTVMIRDSSYMFVTGPAVVRTVTGESVGCEELGGAVVHSSKSGVSHYMAVDEEDGLRWIRDLLSYLPSNNREEVPLKDVCVSDKRNLISLVNLVPENPVKAYDMLALVKEVVDGGEFFEIHGEWAKNIIVGFARIAGRAVGIIANQPKVFAGVLDVNASRKAARFVRFCDAFNIPLVTFVDVPGFLCGTSQEYDAIITHGAKLLYAYGEATVPKVTVTLRKSYGGAHITMACKQLGGDCNLAWPSANVAVMGADAAVEILYSKDLSSIDDPVLRKEFADMKKQEYETELCDLSKAVDSGYLDEVIRPEETREKIISALDGLVNKKECRPWKKHDNLPL